MPVWFPKIKTLTTKHRMTSKGRDSNRPSNYEQCGHVSPSAFPVSASKHLQSLSVSLPHASRKGVPFPSTASLIPQTAAGTRPGLAQSSSLSRPPRASPVSPLCRRPWDLLEGTSAALSWRGSTLDTRAAREVNQRVDSHRKVMASPALNLTRIKIGKYHFPTK